MIHSILLGVVGGLGLFLFGMAQMSDGLKSVAGRKLKVILETMTKKTYIGFVVGALVTAFIQSSSATTVIVIGLVNAGLLTLKQSVGVIIGSNVGTTATAWLVSIAGLGNEAVETATKTHEVVNTSGGIPVSLEMCALPIGVGFLLQLCGRSRALKSFGTVLLGFGMLFLGVELMKGGFKPLGDDPRVEMIFRTYGSNPFLVAFIGMTLTMLIQSSSASIAIVQLMAMGGAFGNNWQMALDMAIPFVLGAHVGTTITAQIAALQANRTAKRAAWVHTLFNVLGMVVVFPFVLLGWYGAMVDYLIPWKLSQATIGPSIAVAHTTTSIVYSVIFLPLAGMLEKGALKIIPVRPSEAVAQAVVLERHLLHTPDIALEQARREIVHMAKIAKGGFMDALAGMLGDDKKKFECAHVAEDFTDTLQYEITTYLTELSRRELSENVAVALPVLLHTVNDLERIGDHAVNVVEIAMRKIEQKLTFSDSALTEMNQLSKEIGEMFDRVIEALEKDDADAARAALPNEQNLNRMQIEFRRSHVQRLRDGLCTPEASLIFIDLVDNVEKTGDHLTNIAQAVIGGLQWDGIELKIAPPR